MPGNIYIVFPYTFVPFYVKEALYSFSLEYPKCQHLFLCFGAIIKKNNLPFQVKPWLKTEWTTQGSHW